MSTAPLLALESVSKVYHRGLLDRTPAFRLAADRAFERAQIVGVMGPNGAGKTTLFEMIAGSNAPSSGRIVVAGQDMQRVRYRQRDRLAIHYHQSYQVRRFRKTKPSFMLDFFRRLRGEGRLVFVCLHPTAPFQLDILREICECFLFVNGGEVAEYPDFVRLTAQPAVRMYLGALAG